MAYGRNGERASLLSACGTAAPIYHLSEEEAKAIIDRQVDAIRSNWDEVADRAGLTTVERKQLWGRQFLNPYAFYGY